MLNMEISLCIKEINDLESLIDRVKDLSMDLIPQGSMRYQQQLRESNAKVFNKFTHLLSTQDHVEDIKFDDKCITNFTDLEIPKEVMAVLSLGPKFAMVPNDKPIIDLASDVELAIKREIPVDSQQEARGDAQVSLAKFSKQNRKLNKIDRFLQKGIQRTKEFLQQHKDVMVSNSDKGNVTIISYKGEYNRKIDELLSDLSMFTPLESDPSQTVKNAVNVWTICTRPI